MLSRRRESETLLRSRSLKILRLISLRLISLKIVKILLAKITFKSSVRIARILLKSVKSAFNTTIGIAFRIYVILGIRKNCLVVRLINLLSPLDNLN